ncbi:MAG TPA: hypothetical protein VNM39_10825 [Verrucomicrobiae bacterium]|nr:hypothetical protein [Verrucomicrobiae bacterium]
MIHPSAEVRCGNCGQVVVLYDPAMFATDLHRRALEACEKMAKSGVYISSEGNQEGFRIGQESLAAKEAAKPKPRWTVEEWRAGGYTVADDGSRWNVNVPEAQARAVAEALNKLESEAAK